MNVDDAPGPFGIFGEYEHLTLRFRNAPHGKRLLAQDLAGDEPVDITALVKFEGVDLHFSGGVLRDEGLGHRTPGDLSSPGVVVAIV